MSAHYSKRRRSRHSALYSLTFLKVLIFLTVLVTFSLLTYQISQLDNVLKFFETGIQFSKNYLDAEIQETVVRNGYVVWSSTCRIPDVNPFHESIAKYIYEWKPKTCSTRPSMTYTSFNIEMQRYFIIINETTLTEYGIEETNVKCCYSPISRKNGDDDRPEYGDSVCFKHQTMLPKEMEFVFVECYSDSSSAVFKTVHGVVANKTDLKTKLNGRKSYSVLILGIDAISRLNLIRAMPKTWEYLQQREWISLKGYNKIDDNTLPNYSAILAGLSFEALRKKCWKNDYDVFDECPFIWKEYKRKSYVTAYAEDSPEISTFNFGKGGFRNSPTDYYTRPLMAAGEEKLAIKWDGNRIYCIGELPQAEYLLQYTAEFVQRFQNHSYFYLLWLNSFSHEKLNQPQAFDQRYRKFLEDLEPYLNSTIVIFLSDHGLRYGDIRLTYVGWFEERMPFINFLLPSSFKEDFPDKYKNLIYNKNRLTSPFDLHATLQEILYGSVRQKPQSCPNCDTLFKKVQFNRTCKDAGIPSHWCTCSSNADAASVTDPLVVSNTRFVLQEINKYLMANNNQQKLTNGTTCAVLSLRKILSVRTQDDPSMLSSIASLTYIIVFETNPSRAILEATVRTQGDFNVENMVSRISAYGNQSSCVLHASVLKYYCFCIQSLKKENIVEN